MQQRQDPGETGTVPAAPANDSLPPAAFWGRSTAVPTGLSIVEIIERGTLDARTAALAWLTLERHGSLLVAALPQGAGKTTVLSALLELLPPSARQVHLAGMAETFAFVGGTRPHETLLLAAELSSHLPVYLWGAPALRAFELVADGYALAGTLHADSADAAMTLLRDEGGIPAAHLEHLALILVISVTGDGDEITGRRVTGAYRPIPGTAGPATAALVEWDAVGERWEHHHAAEAEAAGSGLDQRTTFLDDLVTRGIREASAIRAAVEAHDINIKKNGDRP